MLIGAGVTVVCLVVAFVVAYFLARYVSRRWARIALLVDHRPVLDELPAARVLVAGDPRRARRAQPGARRARASCASRRCCSSTTTSGRSSCSSTCTSRSRRWSCTRRSSGSTSRSSRRPRTSAPSPIQAFRHVLLPQIRPGPDHGLHLRLHPDPGRVPDPIDGRRRAGPADRQPARQLLQERPHPRGRGGRLPDRRVRAPSC